MHSSPTARRDWWSYAGDNGASRYSPLDRIDRIDRIDRGNVSRLRIAWQWSSPDEAIAAAHADVAAGEFQATAIQAGGMLYLSTAMSQVVALDARTGRLRWVFHTIPRPGEQGHDTWENGSWSAMGNTNVWAPMSADDDLVRRSTGRA